MTLLFAWFCLFLLPENQCPSRRCSRPADDGYRRATDAELAYAARRKRAVAILALASVGC